MKSKKQLTDEAVEAFESSLDLAAELRRSVKEMIAKTGTRVEVSPVASARIKSGLSQTEFADLLGVSVRTPGMGAGAPLTVWGSEDADCNCGTPA